MTPEHELDPDALGDHFDRLYRAAWGRGGSREDAEDLVQDTYARVLARPRVVRRDDDLGYLLRVLRNTFVSSRRTAARRPQTAPGAEPEALDLPDERRAAAEPAVAAETREVYRAISELSDDFRDALVAIDVAGVSPRAAPRAPEGGAGTITRRLLPARREGA